MQLWLLYIVLILQLLSLLLRLMLSRLIALLAVLYSGYSVGGNNMVTKGYFCEPMAINSSGYAAPVTERGVNNGDASVKKD